MLMIETIIALIFRNILKLLVFSDRMLDIALALMGFVSRSIKVYPINEQGMNIFRIVKKGKSPTDNDVFSIKINLDLFVKYNVVINNINLNYYINAAPGNIKIDINSINQRCGGSYRMLNPFYIQKKQVVKLFVCREFICKYACADGADYGNIILDIEVVMDSILSGIKVITINGILKPGGRLEKIALSIKRKVIN